MAYSAEMRRGVRAAYVYERLPLERAAERHGVAHTTAARWKRVAEAAGDDWDRARAAASLSGEGIRSVAQAVLEDYLLQHKATLEALRDPETPISPIARAEVLSRLSDSFHKTVAAHTRMSPELSRLAVAMDVMQQLAAFIREHYPQHVTGFLEVLEPFGERLTDLYA